VKINLYVVHGPFISIYNIITNRWIAHFKFEEGDILQMLKISSKKDKKDKTEFAVILKSGSVYCSLYTHVFSKELKDKMQTIKPNMRTLYVEGKILKISND
jgi:hypothetical protein